MQCFCSPSKPDCPPSRQKECADGVSHCLLSLVWNEETHSFVESIQDCWMWTDKSRCPETAGPCHILQESVEKFMACCCKGPLCNNATDIRFVSVPGPGASPLSPITLASNSSLLSFPEDSTPPADSRSFIPVVVPSALILCLALVIFFILYCRRTRGRALKQKKNFDIPLPKHHCECQLMKLKTSTMLPTCTCDQLSRGLNDVEEQANGFQRSKRLPAVGVGWLTPDEVEGLASVVTKLELKSQGCFGQVWHGQFEEPPHGSSEMGRCTDVAVKVFRAAQKDSWITELGLFRVPGLSHPNILKFIGADQTMNNCLDPPEVEYWLVTEYHQLGSLYDYLKTHTIHWKELLQIAVGVARGLSHLHSEITSVGGNTVLMEPTKPSIAHRDLNSRNVLLKSDMSACIADFGLAIRFEPGHFPSDAHPQLGTRRYMAPEVLDGAIQFSRDAYLRIDVYAMGLVFWELMSRCYGSLEAPIEVADAYRAPFELELGPAPTIEELQRFVAQEKQRPKFNPNWSHSLLMCTLWETTEECWDQDAEARLSAGCVAERLATLSSQPWSGSQLYGQGVPKSSNILSHCPTSLSGLTFRPVQPVSVVRTSNRVGASSLISFPVPSTSVPLTTSYDYLHNPKCRDIQEGTSNGSLSRLFPVTRPSLTANDCD
ncbi:Activin receptor type-2B [Clonorchis sinensis]|uniref:receptor protein serine/threonine kinase n=2 Tax=Clonorchis sinensis TaxID=79923 RepID=A0A8T1MLV5_CLOSI|nr:Activin receptor type-2B [Clonorchis sinensis]